MLKVLNTSPYFREVAVIDINTNKKDSINLQPFGRVDLAENLMVDPAYERVNPDIKVKELT